MYGVYFGVFNWWVLNELFIVEEKISYFLEESLVLVLLGYILLKVF